MVFMLGKLNNRLDSKEIEIANVWLMFEHHNNNKKNKRILQFCHSHAFVSTFTTNRHEILNVFFSYAIVMHLFPLLRQTDTKS